MYRVGEGDTSTRVLLKMHVCNLRMYVIYVCVYLYAVRVVLGHAGTGSS